MPRAAQFEPDWVSPPGDTISEILSEKGVSLAEFARRMGTSVVEAGQLADGDLAIDDTIAEGLERVLGPPVPFWVKREAQYRADVARGERGVEATSERDWLANLPFADMRKFGWIDAETTKRDQLKTCLRFFDVADVGAWHRRYRAELAVAAFRTSPTFEANPYSVATWLRWATIAAAGIDCLPWDRSKFANRLVVLKSLSRKKDPARFLPELRASCAACGVALVVARAPKGCRASGATRFLSASKALIVLSFRYRSDDQFWFTFFHEAGHLLLHNKDALFLEDDSESTATEEAEANAFAAQVLIPPELAPELMCLRPVFKEIIGFARKAGVSPGVVVGQLQHLGRVRRDRLNGLKRRYSWDTASVVRFNP